ncbi:MAG: helicase C-terminal domain-containing protein, partial [Chloroflexi bacterium]|nr:helicase C-terminal domain-containing protein [Chloroflexota bacterium]
VRAINKFKNLSTLHSLFAQITDYVPQAAMPYVKIPALKGGQVRTIQTPTHPQWAEYVQPWINQRMANFRANPTYKDRHGVMHGERKIIPFTKDSKGEWRKTDKWENVANIIDDSAMAALDLRIVKGFQGVEDFPESRVQQTADLVADFYRRTTEATSTTPEKGAAFVFADVGTPKKTEPLSFLQDVAALEDEQTEDEQTEAKERAEDDASDLSGFNLYDAVKNALVDRGIPAHEIAFVQQAKGDLQRRVLYRAVQDGRVRVLIGSTDIGGTGVNVQRRLGLMVHMDVPKLQRPGDLHQREGRILRQGNLFKEIEIVRFVTPGTADELKFMSIIRKAKFIDALMKGDVDVWEDIVLSTSQDLETAQRLATGDMRVLEVRDKKQARARLIASRTNEATKRREQQMKLRYLQKDVLPAYERKLIRMQEFNDNEWVKQVGDDVTLKVEPKYSFSHYGGQFRASATGTTDANAVFPRLIQHFENDGAQREQFKVTLGGMLFELNLSSESRNGQKYTAGTFDDELTA